LDREPFLTARWRFLLLLNYVLDPAVLAPLVPRGTELDTWSGRTYASVVGFRFLATRVRGCAVPFHRDFDEINLRFYVRRRVPEGWRRGVVFVKEIVPLPAIALVARAVYQERYVARPMRHRLDLAGGELAPGARVEYGWREGARPQRLHARIEGEAAPLLAGSEEAFLTEHYWGYTARRDGACHEYRVEHPPWKVWRARDAALECDVARVYGAAFVDTLTARPFSACVADGSAVRVHPGERL